MTGNKELNWLTLAKVIRRRQLKLPYERLTAVSVCSTDLSDFIPTLNRARGLKCSDPRDRIFAFLGLKYYLSDASTGTARRNETNYNISVEEVYYDLGVKELEAGNLLQLLQAVNHGPSLKAWPTDIPSWIPDWRNPASQSISRSGWNSKTKSVDLHTGGVLVSGIRFDVVESASCRFLQSLDRAADKTVAEDFWCNHILPLSGTISTSEGQLAATIELIEPDVKYFTFLKLNDLPLLGQMDLISLTQQIHWAISRQIIDAAGELLVQNLVFCAAISSGKLYTGDILRLLSNFTDSYKNLQSKDDTSSSKMLSSMHRSWGAFSALWDTFDFKDRFEVRLVQTPVEFLQSNRLFRTTRNYIGKGPEALQEGDVVAFLDGAHNACILRQQQDFYQYVGAAFVPGLTRTNLRNKLDEEWVQHEQFEIR